MSQSEKKAPRAIAEIQKEYAAICQRAGYVQYQLFVNQKDLDMLNESLRNLNIEAGEAQKASTEAAVNASSPEVKGDSTNG